MADRVHEEGEIGRRGLLAASILFLVVGLALPLWELATRSVEDADGRFTGLDNFREFFTHPHLYRALVNSFLVSGATTLLTVPLAYAFAYAIMRTQMPGKAFFRQLALLPLYAPTMLAGIGLVYLFGRMGLVTTGFFETFPRLAVDIGLYGATGIILAESLLAFPAAVMILMTALAGADARLYEAAESLGASKPRIFWSVTLPGTKYGLLSAGFVCFTFAFTDFGAPKVVGGSFPVMATDIYKHVIGQQNFAMGATASLVMIAPTLAAFLGDQWIRRRQHGAFSARSVPLAPRRSRWRDWIAFAFCVAASAAILSVFGAAGAGAFVKHWPYGLELTLRHFDFSRTAGSGYSALWNSLRLATYSAVAGTAVTFGAAYLTEKGRGLERWRRLTRVLALVPLALPGLVLGLAYIFLFNREAFAVMGLEIPNPLSRLYGTMALLVICSIIHFYTVGFLTATTALRQLDAEFELAGESLGAPFYVTFWRVTLPLCLPAVCEIAGYFFVSTMATVSAVIFLYTPDLRLASVVVVNMDDAGNTASAAAMGMLIVLVNVVARTLFGLAGWLAERRTARWRNSRA